MDFGPAGIVTPQRSESESMSLLAPEQEVCALRPLPMRELLLYLVTSRFGRSSVMPGLPMSPTLFQGLLGEDFKADAISRLRAARALLWAATRAS
jgi:hypothetical protein